MSGLNLLHKSALNPQTSKNIFCVQKCEKYMLSHLQQILTCIFNIYSYFFSENMKKGVEREYDSNRIYITHRECIEKLFYIITIIL